jgi:hypothetical protein
VGARPSERDNGGRWRVGQAAACRALRRTGPRNVRTPPGTVLGNTQSGRPAGKCHREQTADGGTGLRSGPAQVRVKRCGKSAPASGATRAARQTPSGARPRRGRAARPQTPPGRPLEPAGNRRPRGMAATDGSAEPSVQNPAYAPTRHHIPSDLRKRTNLRHDQLADLSHLGGQYELLQADGLRQHRLSAETCEGRGPRSAFPPTRGSSSVQIRIRASGERLRGADASPVLSMFLTFRNPTNVQWVLGVSGLPTEDDGLTEHHLGKVKSLLAGGRYNRWSRSVRRSFTAGVRWNRSRPLELSSRWSSKHTAPRCTPSANRDRPCYTTTMATSSSSPWNFVPSMRPSGRGRPVRDRVNQLPVRVGQNCSSWRNPSRNALMRSNGVPRPTPGRCAELDGSRARLVAGAGIVAGSAPEAAMGRDAGKARAHAPGTGAPVSLTDIRWPGGADPQ